MLKPSPVDMLATIISIYVGDRLSLSIQLVELVQRLLYIFLQIHFVHYSNKYSSLSEAVSQGSGLAVLGVFAQVFLYHSNLRLIWLLDVKSVGLISYFSDSTHRKLDATQSVVKLMKHILIRPDPVCHNPT